MFWTATIGKIRCDMKSLQAKDNSGFTIIELMIVVVIVAILLAIAYPSYINYVRKATRGEAQQLLMNWAINQEIFRSNNTSYAPDTSTALPKPVHPDNKFVFTAHGAVDTSGGTCATPTGTPSATAFWLVAVAQGDQANDNARGTSCATLCLSSAGPKQPAICWD